MIVFCVNARTFIRQSSWRDIGFHPDNRFYALPSAFLVKFQSAIHHAVIGQRQGFHAHCLGARHQIGNF